MPIPESGVSQSLGAYPLNYSWLTTVEKLYGQIAEKQPSISASECLQFLSGASSKLVTKALRKAPRSHRQQAMALFTSLATWCSLPMSISHLSEMRSPKVTVRFHPCFAIPLSWIRSDMVPDGTIMVIPPYSPFRSTLIE